MLLPGGSICNKLTSSERRYSEFRSMPSVLR